MPLRLVDNTPRPCGICGQSHARRPTSMNVCVRTLQERVAQLERELARLRAPQFSDPDEPSEAEVDAWQERVTLQQKETPCQL